MVLGSGLAASDGFGCRFFRLRKVNSKKKRAALRAFLT
jgi:hypothetical protein